jgi:hypothetical protein
MALRASRTGRWTDRIEDGTAWLLFTVALLAILFGCGLGVRVHDQLTEQGRAEARERTPAVATLLETAPTITSGYAVDASVGVTATWPDRWGTPHRGIVTAPQAQEAGSTVPIWIDRSGASVSPPTSARDAFAVGVLAAAVAIGACLAVLACLWEIVRRVVLAHNCAAWEREWREVAPIWSRGEGKRG